MISLGKILINHQRSINESRKKILIVVKSLTGDPIIATRVATATSQMCRLLYRASITPRIELEIDTSVGYPALSLSFIDQQPLPGTHLLTPFFDEVRSLSPNNDSYRVQSLLWLRDRRLPSSSTIAELKAIIEQKSRNELMTEIESKNHELQESIENLKQTISIKEKLKKENIRLSTELEVTKKLQQMILPKQSELDSIEELEIACFMEPADEVGGDYYDVLNHNGSIKIGIGDVTGHGLESGVLMLMVQTAVRTLKESQVTDPVKFLDILNRTIYGNIERMNSDKNLTLALLDYADGTLSLSGQHEELLVVRAGGKLERIDTCNLGFPIGLEEEITDLIAQEHVQLNSGDVVVLYTDGITEAEDINHKQYGLERLCEVVSRNWKLSAQAIRQAVIDDLMTLLW